MGRRDFYPDIQMSKSCVFALEETQFYTTGM